MKYSFLIAVFAMILPLSLISAEPSAFGAGDLDNPNPYGLTSTEETLLQNKKDLRKIQVKSNNQANEVQSLRERIDGLQSIIESISASSRKNKLSVKAMNKKSEKDFKSTQEFTQRFSESLELNTKSIEINKQEIDKINTILIEMSKLIETINTTYVTKDEFNTLVNDVNNFKGLVTKELKKSSQPKISKLDKMKNGEVATQAKKYYDKKYYTKALEYYQHLIKKKYKPARSHYMIGEIYFNRKNYADAIAYFKKSSSLYKKASYMPTLLLHTAISMDKTGDKDNAKVFYNGVISNFPESSAAVTAQKKLDKVK